MPGGTRGSRSIPSLRPKVSWLGTKPGSAVARSWLLVPTTGSRYTSSQTPKFLSAHHHMSKLHAHHHKQQAVRPLSSPFSTWSTSSSSTFHLKHCQHRQAACRPALPSFQALFSVIGRPKNEKEDIERNGFFSTFQPVQFCTVC